VNVSSGSAKLVIWLSQKNRERVAGREDPVESPTQGGTRLLPDCGQEAFRDRWTTGSILCSVGVGHFFTLLLFICVFFGNLCLFV